MDRDAKHFDRSESYHILGKGASHLQDGKLLFTMLWRLIGLGLEGCMRCCKNGLGCGQPFAINRPLEPQPAVYGIVDGDIEKEDFTIDHKNTNSDGSG